MSQPLISRSPDLQRLVADGYSITVEQGHLVMHDVPYVNSRSEVRLGKLVSTLSVSGDQTIKPDTHVAMFQGEHPCDKDGTRLEKIAHSSGTQALGGGLTVDHTFSSKPQDGYPDYYAKMTTYAALVSSPAAAIDPSSTPRSRRIYEASDDSPFAYLDNASGRAGITAVMQRLRAPSVAIVGLGGTGSYVLDLLAKTPVGEIHLYDGDDFEQHNAFRAPGAPSVEELRRKPKKVDYFADIYSRMHRGIVPHALFITEENVEQLSNHSMVFMCLDANDIKASIVATLERAGVTFIDVGMGVELVDSRLVGTLRTTLSTPEFRSHVHDRSRIPMKKIDGNDLYARNIQLADLNALNACLAVLRWKRHVGFYADTENEHFSLYHVDANHVLNEDFT
jgi:hypothetical protein